MALGISKIKTFSPASDTKKPQEKDIIPRKPKSAPVIYKEFLNITYNDHSFKLAPELWNNLVAFIRELFPALLCWAEGFLREMTGEALEAHLFNELRAILVEQGRKRASEFQPLIDRGYIGTVLSCPRCESIMEFNEYKEAKFLSSLGWVKLMRAYYLCKNKECRHTLFPLDVKLGCTEHRILPWVIEKTVQCSSEVPFQPAVELITHMLGIPGGLCVPTAEEICWDVAKKIKKEQDDEVYSMYKDEKGSELPPIEGETPALLVVSTDGTHVPTGEKAVFHEARWGVVSRILDDVTLSVSRNVSEPILGEHTYVAHIGNADDFFEYFAVECARRGAYKTKTLVMKGDGAPWIWNRFRDHFFDAWQVFFSF